MFLDRISSCSSMCFIAFLSFSAFSLRIFICMPHTAPANSVDEPLLFAYEIKLLIDTVADNDTDLLPSGIVTLPSSLYSLILPEAIVAISSLTISSFKISVFTDTNTPNDCSMALRKAFAVASSFVLPSPFTTRVTVS